LIVDLNLLDKNNRSPLGLRATTTSAKLNPTQAGGLLSLAAFRAWLTHAKPGERLEYYRGLLALDRVKGMSSLRETERRKLTAVADRASALAGQGTLRLLQGRHGDGDYSYWAIARVLARSVEQPFEGPRP
jgi:hypothetical protein